MTKDQQIKNIVAELKKDKEFSECTEEELIEVAEMEIKAGNIKRYEHTFEKKPKKPKEIKLDDEKIKLINLVANFLITEGFEVNISNPQKMIDFKYNGSDYSLSLIKHRPTKK